MNAASEESRCPSARAEPGAVVIGAVQQDGRVAHFATTLVANEAFLATVGAQGSPEQRFRFSSPCAEGKCAQWTGQACGLIDRLAKSLTNATEASTAEDPAPPCTIRAGCRWFQQNSYAACGVCSFVVTDPGVTTAQGASPGCA